MTFDWTPLPHVEGGLLALLLTVVLYVVAVFGVLAVGDGLLAVGRRFREGYRRERPRS